MRGRSARILADILLSGTILRNLILLMIMSGGLAAFFFTPTRASEIIFGFDCFAFHFTPPGGPDGGATCTGVCACYSSVNDSISFMTDTVNANAWCGNATVLNEASVDFTFSEIRGSAAGYSMSTGKPVATLMGTLGCDPGDVKKEVRTSNFDNCDPEIAEGGGGTCDTFVCYQPSPNEQVPYEWEVCCANSPVVVDVAGDGFDLTDGAGGVDFDLTGDGVPERLAWTRAGSDDAWLVLDRDGNGVVDSGRELFGTHTPQPAPPAGEQRNGFLALSVYDLAGNGGNADGVIDARDAVYSSSRLWQDANHDGISQPAELHTLQELDVIRLHLDYKESKRTDANGNRSRYRAKVDDARGAKVNRWAWDVFLVSGR